MKKMQEIMSSTEEILVYSINPDEIFIYAVQQYFIDYRYLYIFLFI